MLDCDIVVTEIEFQSHYYVPLRINTFAKGMNAFISPAMGWIVPLMSFQKDDFGIKKPTKVDLLLNKEIKDQTIIGTLSFLCYIFNKEWIITKFI